MEDNAACVALANDGEKYRPRTRHLSIKWHHFRDLVKSKYLAVTKIGTKENEADIFTKSVPYPQFSYLRDRLMGWVEQDYNPFRKTSESKLALLATITQEYHDYIDAIWDD